MLYTIPVGLAGTVVFDARESSPSSLTVFFDPKKVKSIDNNQQEKNVTPHNNKLPSTYILHSEIKTKNFFLVKLIMFEIHNSFLVQQRLIFCPGTKPAT